jgi:hypothetical protein
MRFLLVFLTLLLVTAACAPVQAISQDIQTPSPVTTISDTPVPSAITSGTPSVVCPCPSGAFPPAPAPGGVVGGTSVICNCPTILVPPTVSPTDGLSTQIPASTTEVTREDNGKTFYLHPGESFLLNLGTDVFDWTVDIDNQNVLSRVKNVMVIRGAQGIYQADNPGQAVLTAVGNPFCRNSVPPCMAPSLLFKITVVVQ